MNDAQAKALRDELSTISGRLYDMNENLVAWQLKTENRLGQGNAKFEATDDKVDINRLAAEKAASDNTKAIKTNQEAIIKHVLAEKKWAVAIIGATTTISTSLTLIYTWAKAKLLGE